MANTAPTLDSLLTVVLGTSTWREEADEGFLLNLGQCVAPTDYAVAHYADPWHPKCFGKRAALITAINRGLESQRHIPITRERVERLAHDWQDRWRQDPSKPSLTATVRAGLDALRTALAVLSDSDVDRLCCAVANTYQDDLDAADWFLEHEMGYTPSDDCDDEEYFRSPQNLAARLSQLDPAELCDFADRVCNAWNWEPPDVPRTDYQAIAERIAHLDWTDESTALC
jgi:hypothetical protein